MVIYADELFFINFISAYILLSILGKFIIKSKIKIWRLCVASAVGSAAAVIIFSREIPLCASYMLRALSAVIMVFISFYEQKQQIPSQILWLAAVSAMLIAAMITLAMLAGRTVGAVIKAGVVYFDLPQKIFLPMLIASYITVAVFLKILGKRRAKRLYTIAVTHNGKKISVTALFDSGNQLCEPVTGKSVSILEWDKARVLFDAGYGFEEIEEHAEEMKLWLVPYHSIGNKSGLMPAFLADRIDILEERKTAEHAFIGLYDGRLSSHNEYSALINAALL